MRMLRIVGAGYLAMTALCAAAAPQMRTVIVEAIGRGYREVPVTVTVTPPAGMEAVKVELGAMRVPAQWERSGKRMAVTWIVRNLARGQRNTYRMTFLRSAPVARTHSVVRVGNDLELRLVGETFARYDVTTGPNKPFFYPVFAPGQAQVVRGFPIEPKLGETNDHPHHQGMWFTHGSVNGEDFWSLSQSKTTHTGFANLISGPIYCGFTAGTAWIGKNGSTIARDTREVRAYILDGARVMDLTITVRPEGAPLVFGDTKEGSFGLRLADSMRLRGGGGHIVNSEGITDGATWGKRARWVDYYGPVGDRVVGVAILDHPSSFRHPTYWHVRDYGLFAANPFGVHDFEPGKGASAGNYTVPVGGAITFRYRLVFHIGNADDARIADRWAELASPPRVTVK